MLFFPKINLENHAAFPNCGKRKRTRPLRPSGLRKAKTHRVPAPFRLAESAKRAGHPRPSARGRAQPAPDIRAPSGPRGHKKTSETQGFGGSVYLFDSRRGPPFREAPVFCLFCSGLKLSLGELRCAAGAFETVLNRYRALKPLILLRFER